MELNVLGPGLIVLVDLVFRSPETQSRDENTRQEHEPETLKYKKSARLQSKLNRFLKYVYT